MGSFGLFRRWEKKIGFSEKWLGPGGRRRKTLYFTDFASDYWKLKVVPNEAPERSFYGQFWVFSPLGEKDWIF